MDIYIHVFLHVKLFLFTHENYDYTCTILPSIFPVIAENCASIVEMNNNRL